MGTAVFLPYHLGMLPHFTCLGRGSPALEQKRRRRGGRGKATSITVTCRQSCSFGLPRAWAARGPGGAASPDDMHSTTAVGWRQTLPTRAPRSACGWLRLGRRVPTAGLAAGRFPAAASIRLLAVPPQTNNVQSAPPPPIPFQGRPISRTCPSMLVRDASSVDPPPSQRERRARPTARQRHARPCTNDQAGAAAEWSTWGGGACLVAHRPVAPSSPMPPTGAPSAGLPRWRALLG